MIPRVFRLHRVVDETGISGTGLIADGVLFSDGTCALRWLTKRRSTALYDSLATLVEIHGHGGKTKVIFEVEGPRALPCCLSCHHPIDDHWGDNCGACMVGPCDCVLMNHPERIPGQETVRR